MNSVLITFLILASIQVSLSSTYTQNRENQTTSLPLFVTPGTGCLTRQQRETATVSKFKTMIASKLNLATRTQCGGDLWTKIAYLNMSDPMQSCPQNWTNRHSTNELRVCGCTNGQCSSVFYPTDGRSYTGVCGRIVGYQFGHPDGIRVKMPNYTIDETYVDGISITHGSPRSHIWTFAATVSEARDQCPCKGGESAPLFVGDNYYCESGYNGTGGGNPPTILYTSDPLFDGLQCESEGSCCSTAPWFAVNLVNPTSDDIEVRICASVATDFEDTPIQLLELYIL